MAKISSSNTTGAGSQPKVPGKCRHCAWSHLIQYDQNPVLAECTVQPQHHNARFPYKVEVAFCERNCNLFRYDPSEKEIEHRTHHIQKEEAVA